MEATILNKVLKANSVGLWDSTDAGWYQYYATVAWDTNSSNRKVGAQSVKLTTTTADGGNWTAWTAKDFSPAISMAGKNIGFWLKAPSTALFFNFRMLTDTGWVGWSSYYQDLTYPRPQGNAWRFFSFDLDAMSKSGSMNFGSIVQILLQVNSTSNSAEFWFSGLYVCDSYVQPNGAIIIRFDDGNYSDIDLAKAAMDTYGYKGCSFVVYDNIGDANYLSLTNCQTLNTAGWDICNHGTTHANLTTLNESQIISEITTCRDFLNSNGMTRASQFFAAPFSAVNPTVESIINNYNSVSTCVLGNSVLTADACLNPRNFFNPYQVDAIDVTYTTTVATLQGWVDKVKAGNGLGIVLFHKLVTGTPAQYQYNSTDFASFLSYISSQGVRVTTFSEIMSQFLLSAQPQHFKREVIRNIARRSLIFLPIKTPVSSFWFGITTVPNVDAADSMTLADAIAILIGKDFTESMTLADAVALLASKGLIDGVQLSDAIELLQGKVLTEEVTLVDAITLLASKGLIDGVQLSDAIELLQGKGLTEGITLADAMSILIGKQYDDGVTLTDFLSFQRSKDLTDAVALGDDISLVVVLFIDTHLPKIRVRLQDDKYVFKIGGLKGNA